MFSQRQIGKIVLLLCCLLLSNATFATTKNPPTSSLINSSIASKTEVKAKEKTSDGYYIFEDHFENGLDEKIWVEKFLDMGISTENGTLVLSNQALVNTMLISKKFDFCEKFKLERKVRRVNVLPPKKGEYASTSYELSLIFDNAWISICNSKSSIDTSSYVSISGTKHNFKHAIWDEWYIEKIIYDNSNKTLEYYLNNKLILSININEINSKSIKFELAVLGFGTEAREETEYIRYTTEKPSSCDFTDVDFSSPYYAPTNFLCERGVLSGAKADGAVKVEDKLTRAQLAKIGFRGLYLTNGRQVPSAVPSDNFPSIYPDISHRTADNEYYYQAARALMYLEYGDGISPFDRNRVNFEPRFAKPSTSNRICRELPIPSPAMQKPSHCSATIP